MRLDVANSVSGSVRMHFLCAPATLSHAVLWTQSESCITTLPSPSEPNPSEPQPCPNFGAPSWVFGLAKDTVGHGRCPTEPAETFSGSRLPPTHSKFIVNPEEGHKDELLVSSSLLCDALF